MAALIGTLLAQFFRSGWFWALLSVETILWWGFWLSGPLPSGAIFDRRMAEADLLFLTLATLPALLAGSLSAAGDLVDGLSDYFRSCRLSATRQVVATCGALVVILSGSMLFAVVASLSLVAPSVLLTPLPWISVGMFALATSWHVCWGYALGSWSRSRLQAVGLALGFWLITVLVAEPFIAAMVAAVRPRWRWAVLEMFLVLLPSQVLRVSTIVIRGQSWVFGPEFLAALQGWSTPLGALGVVVLGIVHQVLPGVLAVGGLTRSRR